MLRLLMLLASGLVAMSAQAAELRLTFVNASTASLGNPHDLKLSPDGRQLFVSDVDNDRVAILDPDTPSGPRILSPSSPTRRALAPFIS